MAREIHTRWKIKGTLQAETPIHVGGMGGDADTDLALAVNGCGQYYIPGTSLAGVFRNWMAREEGDIARLWGFQEQDRGQASFILIEDAEVHLSHQTIEIREGVGIDRHRGTAADGAKYSRAILPKGVWFPLNLTLDCQKDETPDKLWKLLLALEYGDLRIGAAKTRGLGKVRLEVTTIHQQNLRDREGIFDVLLKGGESCQWQALKPQAYNPPAKLTLEIAWHPRDPVMVKTEGEGIAVDILPLVSQVNGRVQFVIPGSSIKGVLRAHAERIVRTVCAQPTPDNFLEQVKLGLVDELFGKAENSRTKHSEGKIGALLIDDCYAKISIDPQNWSNVENQAKGEQEEFQPFQNALRTALDLPANSSENPFRTLQPAMHVAVDRWTGGAAEGMLYTVLEPIGVPWEPIGIHLDLERLQQAQSNPVKPAIALLLLVLRDFSDRKIPIGYGTNRGMGTVEATAMAMNCSPIEGLTAMENQTEIAPDLSNLGEDLLQSLTEAWKSWIKSNSEVG